MMPSNWLVSICLITLISTIFITVTHAHDEVVTCGGFITASSTLAETQPLQLDYSFIKIHLFTKNTQLLKYTATASPNGYYFIPVYDRGSFYLELEGPSGWSFEPRTYEFDVDEKGHGCRDDINFKFTGFGLTGTVGGPSTSSCHASSHGPSGVTITLSSSTSASTTTATTNNHGEFTFPNILPGTYQLTASHSHYQFINNQQQATVEWGNSAIKQPFRIKGYTLSGHVVSGSEGRTGIDVYLLSTDSTRPEVSCEKPTSKDIPTRQGSHVLCHTRTDLKGTYSFTNLPCGQYIVVPHVSRYDVIPKEMKVDVEHGDMMVKESFRIEGSSVTGRVVDTVGEGVGGVTIAVNGVNRTITASDGTYQLDRMSKGKYTITAKLQHWFFDPLKIAISPSVTTLPDIEVARFHLCGKVNSTEPVTSRTILVAGIKEEIETTTNEDGSYCVEVIPGPYTIFPQLTQSEESRGLLLYPVERAITIENQPELGQDFTMAKISVGGIVKCIESCDAPIQVKLTSTITGDIIQTVTIDSEQRFLFTHVYPGQYRVTVHHDEWCWDELHSDVTVQYNDITDLELVQSGYLLQCTLSHNITLKIDRQGSNDETKTFNLKAGANKFCLAKPGIYQLHPVSCYRFEHDTYLFNTQKPHMLDLQATDYKVTGTIHVSPAQDYVDTASIPVQIKDTTNGKISTIHAEYEKTDKENDKDVRIYRYNVWASPSHHIEITPQISSSSSLLFFPRTRELTLSSTTCPPPVPSFGARVGSFLNGRVSPPVENVLISVNDEHNTMITTTTSSDGTYRLGPLYDMEHIQVTASKEGYLFADGGKKGHFNVIKLARITINIKDQNNTGVAGVLLSLTGGDSYKNNSQSDNTGSFSFLGLYPGKYFLRPLYKEYTFTPSSLSIDLQSAQEFHETIKATRTAYSVYGSVRSLNGEAERGCIVEALEQTSQQKHARHEETTTDAQGEYRLRGLIPGSTYQISVRPNSGSVSHASPSTVTLHITRQDTYDINFIGFRPLNKWDLTGEVKTSKWADTLEVVLTSTTSGSVIRTLPISSAHPFFDFSPLPVDTYTLSLRSSLSSRTHDIQSSSQTITLKDHTHVVLSFDATVKPISQEHVQHSFGRIVFGGVLVVIFLYRHEILRFMTLTIRRIQKQRASAAAAASAIATPLHDDNDDDWGVKKRGRHSIKSMKKGLHKD